MPGTKPLTDALGNASPSLKATETFTMFPGYTSIIYVSSLNSAGATGSGATADLASTAKGSTATAAGGASTGSQGTATGTGIVAAVTPAKSSATERMVVGWPLAGGLVVVGFLVDFFFSVSL